MIAVVITLTYKGNRFLLFNETMSKLFANRTIKRNNSGDFLVLVSV